MGTGAPVDLGRRSGETRDDLAEFRCNFATVEVWEDWTVGLSSQRSVDPFRGGCGWVEGGIDLHFAVDLDRKIHCC